MDVSKLKTVELRSKLEALGLDRKGNKRALVARLKKALNVLPASSVLDTSMNGEETSTSQKNSRATKQSSPRQSSLTPQEHLPDAIREEPENITETLVANSCEQKQITVELNWNSNQNNWYNAFDEMDQSSIDIKEEIVSKELNQAAHESKTSEYQGNDDKTTMPLKTTKTAQERQKIALLRQKGLSVAAIARKTGVARNTINLWIRQWKKKGNVKEVKKSGRPRKTFSTQDSNIIQRLKKNLVIKTKNFASSNISYNTVRRRLGEAGEHCRTQARKKNWQGDDVDEKTMPAKTPTTAHKRHKIVLLKQEGFSVAAIARKTGVARNTVYLWIKRWENKGNIKEVKKSGRPRKTSSTQDSDIIQKLKENPFIQTKNLASSHNISYNTVRRRLREAGEHGRIPARKKNRRSNVDQKTTPLKTPTTAPERHKIVSLRQEGLSIAAIARKTGLARNTVYLWIKRWKNNGNINEVKKSGRPRKTSSTQDSDIIKKLKEDPFIPIKNLASSHNISYNTVRRRICEAGEQNGIPERKKNCRSNDDKNTIPIIIPTTENDRQKIVSLKQEGFTVTDIARKTGLTRTTVHFWIRRWENKDEVKEIKKIGRPRITTSIQDSDIIQKLKENPFIETKNLVSPHNISYDTVRRRLREAGEHCRIRARKKNCRSNDEEKTLRLKTPTTAHERHKIVLLRQEGFSVAAIAKKTGVARNTVYLWIRRWENKENINEVKRSGRPRKTSSTQDSDIIQKLKENPLIQTKNVASSHNISYNTVRRRLLESGVHHRTPARKKNCKAKDDKTTRPVKTPMTAHKRHKIVLMRQEGFSVAAIARKTGVARNTVYLWIRRWESEGNINKIKKSGRPRKTPSTQDSDIIQT